MRCKRTNLSIWPVSKAHLGMVAALMAFVTILSGAAGPAAHADDKGSLEALGIAMEGYPYPRPVQFHPVTYRGQDLRMGYMDVAPAGPANGRAVTLLHGANFFGAYWESTIEALSAAGYRVIVPDQIGFGKSSKPTLPYSFHWLAANTKALLEALGVERTVVVGHSMGGMLASRFALMYPDATEKLVLVNPLGLEDYRHTVPWVSADAVYKSTLAQTEDKIRAYHKTYYVTWKDAYDAFVKVHYRWTLSGEYPRMAWARALIVQMILLQPVVYEFPLIQAPTLLVIGQADRTSPGRGRVPEAVRRTIGQFPALGRAAAEAIPNAELVTFDGVGHIPHLEVPEQFEDALLSFLE